MAEIDFQTFPCVNQHGGQLHGCYIIQWTLAGGDTGKPYVAPDYPDKTVEIDPGGGFGTSTLAIEGDNALVAAGLGTMRVLNDPQGNALSGINTGKVEAVLENVNRIRPNLAAGTGAAVIVRLLLSTVARR